MDCLSKNEGLLGEMNKVLDIHISKICSEFEEILERLTTMKSTIIKEVEEYKI